MRILENERLCVKIADAGAELVSIYDKEKEREIMWQADAKYWKRHAPVLFPNVGKHFENVIRIEGKEFSTKQHGFARDTDFTCIFESQTEVVHELTDNEQTREYWPYEFKLHIRHRLEGNQLFVCWEVENTGDKKMYFTIGGHPAFAVPKEAGSFENCTLYFPEKEELTYLLLDAKTGTVLKDQKKTLKLENHSYKITKDMFDLDALVFDDNQISSVTLQDEKNQPYVTLNSPKFPNFGIWSVPQAPFVCLEPWCGRCDDYGFTGNISQKKDICSAGIQEKFVREYSIVVE